MFSPCAGDLSFHRIARLEDAGEHRSQVGGAVVGRPRPTGYIPSLDGWRALAISAVLFDHSNEVFLHGTSLRPLQDVSGMGVNLFFAISGLLITTRILQEEQIRGKFDLRGFYIRRLFRIQPAAFVYLAVIAVLMLSRTIPGEWRFWFAALFMVENFFYRGIPFDAPPFFVGHFWSLAVEEHFYLLLSSFLYFIKRRRALALGLLYVVLFYAIRAASRHIEQAPWLERQTQWQLINLVFPSLVAVLLFRAPVRRFTERWIRPWAAALVWLACVSAHRIAGALHKGQAILAYPAVVREVYFLPEIFFTLIIVSTMTHSRSWSTRVLELPPLRWLGRISYSLYLWHVLFFSSVLPEIHLHSRVLQLLSTTPAKYVAAIAAATLSYYFIEKPLMRKGHKLARPALPGRPELDIANKTA